MTETPRMNHLIQQHILEHEMRLKHVDTLLERAQQGIAKTGGDDTAAELARAKTARDKLSSQVEAYKQLPPEQWAETEFERKGPMIVWDNLAKQLEKLVERMEH